MCKYEVSENSVAVSCCGICGDDYQFLQSEEAPSVKLAAEEALGLIGGARMGHYGAPWDNLADIAAAWSPYVKRALQAHGELTATDVCGLMVILKILRQARGYHRDSTVDAIGYAELTEVINDDGARAEFVRRSKENDEC